MAFSPETKSWLRRRIPTYLLLIGLGVIILQYWQRQPSTMRVTYRLGTYAAGLKSATMVYRQDREGVARVRFGFSRRHAAKDVSHDLKLPDGDYDVDIALSYGRRRAGTSGREEGPPRTLHLHRLLLVRGDGAGIIYLDRAP